MQQFITSSEACALLDRILQTSQSLNKAISKYVLPNIQTKPAATAIPSPPPVAETAVLPMKKAEPAVPSIDDAPIAPVLTIKLSDLVREGEYSRQRRLQQQRGRNQRPPKPRHKRQMRDVEVLYKRGFRMVS